LQLGTRNAAANRVSGVIEEVVYTGDALKLRMRSSAGFVFAFRADRRSAAEVLKAGDSAVLSWGAEDTVLIDAHP
jgi:hypothetical protein